MKIHCLRRFFSTQIVIAKRWCLAFLRWTFLLHLLKTEHQIIQLFIGRLQSNIYYRSQRSCGQGNVFAPVCHSVHGGGCMLGYHPPQGADTSQEQTPLRSRHPPRADPPEQTPPPRIRSMSGWYASYWNAFLFSSVTLLNQTILPVHSVVFVDIPFTMVSFLHWIPFTSIGRNISSALRSFCKSIIVFNNLHPVIVINVSLACWILLLVDTCVHVMISFCHLS